MSFFASDPGDDLLDELEDFLEETSLKVDMPIAIVEECPTPKAYVDFLCEEFEAVDSLHEERWLEELVNEVREPMMEVFELAAHQVEAKAKLAVIIPASSRRFRWPRLWKKLSVREMPRLKMSWGMKVLYFVVVLTVFALAAVLFMGTGRWVEILLVALLGIALSAPFEGWGVYRYLSWVSWPFENELPFKTVRDLAVAYDIRRCVENRQPWTRQLLRYVVMEGLKKQGVKMVPENFTRTFAELERELENGA